MDLLQDRLLLGLNLSPGGTQRYSAETASASTCSAFTAAAFAARACCGYGIRLLDRVGAGLPCAMIICCGEKLMNPTWNMLSGSHRSGVMCFPGLESLLIVARLVESVSRTKGSLTKQAENMAGITATIA